MSEIGSILVTIGLLFLAGLFMETLGRRAHIPRVTLLLIVGFIIGPSILNILPDSVNKLFPYITDIALAIVGFLLGGKLKLSSLRYHGKNVLWISLATALITTIIVFLGLMLIGINFKIALLLAGIAAATDPAATMDVIHENRANGPFTSTLIGIVAIDDVWALLIFSIVFVIVQALHFSTFSIHFFITCSWELFGAILLGIILGIPMAYLTGRIKPGEPTLVEALGIVLVCCGIALWIKVSFLLASMVLGIVVVNLAHHHMRPFHEIENIEWPFMILFFILAGVSLHIQKIIAIGILGLAYIFFRLFGRLLGAWLGSQWCQANPLIKRWMGMALMPQAGVAIGMALVAIETFPEMRDTLLPIALGATILFELVGPILTRTALTKVGETRGTKHA